MAVNLINTLWNELSDDMTGRIAAFLGESPANTQSAIKDAVPATVGMMAQKAQNPQGAADLFGLMQRGGFDGTSEGLGNLLKSGTGMSERIRMGTSMLSSLFGNRQSAVTDVIAARAGIRPQSATSLFSLVVPFVMNIIGREASAAGGFNAASIARLLGDQMGFLRSAAPAGLMSALGFGAPDETPRTYEPRVSEAPRAEPARTYAHSEPAPTRDRDGGLGWLKWAIPLLLLGLVVWGFSAFRNRQPDREMASVTEGTPVGTAGNVVLVKQRLSCGQELDVAPSGIERRLVSFIDDKGRRVDKETWFTFDRLAFETGSANLASASEPQIRNIAEILRCYPTVNLKIGGYTDNTGDAAANQRLSQARAEAARQAIVRQGIEPTRIEAEGYGQEHPVASNDTDDGRQRNRRIDVLVTKK
jgi:outer membrane protein OmpA-like peptidoglycan-associated protein